MNTPIVDFVKKYADSNSLRLHMPGHKGDGFLGVEKYDITEIDGADVLYSAKGIIAESQKNATELFGTKATLFSTEGSSLCIRAMLWLLKAYAHQNGEKPIIAAGRNAHKTFVLAASFLGIDVDWLMPDDTQTVLSCDITADYLENYLSRVNQKPVAVYITCPDYLGHVTNIKALSEVCKKHKVLVVVDNAHGAYFRFLENDCHPISLGADMCCDSAHKTLPVLTGGAYLHIGHNVPKFFASNAQMALGVFASTSPSYLILQSLDAANKYLADEYRKKLANFIIACEELKNDLKDVGYSLYGEEPLKITIAAKLYGYTGNEMADILLKDNIVCEFADPDYIVFMLSPEINKTELERLKNSLLKISKKTPLIQPVLFSRSCKTRLSLQAAIYSQKQKLPIEECVGRISAELDAICPPAIPIVLPGEEIDVEMLIRFKRYGISEWTVIK